MPEPLQRLVRWLLPVEPEYAPSPGRRLWLLALYTLRRALSEDRCSAMSSVLTVETVLSIVPVLGLALVGVSLLDPNDGQRLLLNLFAGWMPDTAQARASAQSVLSFARNVTVGNLGTWGFLTALGIAYLSFDSLERTFNRIWRVTRRRHLLVKFTLFYTLATLGPLVFLYSLRQSLFHDVSNTPWAPRLAIAATLIALYRWLPNRRVSWRASLVGGLLAAILYELGKAGFTAYVQRIATTYEGLYGPLAVLPLFIVWAYLSWLVVLLGAETAFVVQHERMIRLQGYVPPFISGAHRGPGGSGRAAARILLAIADNFARRSESLTADRLAERFRLPVERVGAILAHLERHGFLAETLADTGPGLVPARPLADIRLVDVLTIFEDDDTDPPRRDELDAPFEALDRARDELVGELTYADLVQHAQARAEAGSRDAAVH